MSLTLEPQEILSPSSINLYLECPREYYYQYIAKIRPDKNIHLVRGSIIHKALEDFFGLSYQTNFDEKFIEVFGNAKKVYADDLESLGLEPEELEEENVITLNILLAYIRSFKQDMKDLVDQGKAENERHAYFLLRPTMRELYVENEEIKCRGFIDKVYRSYDDKLIISDYKTSSRYGTGLREDYRRQVAIYSLLYFLQEGEMPDYASVVFLRYGKEILLEVNDSLLDYARETINTVYEKTRSVRIEDYPEGEECRFCSHKDISEESLQERILKNLGENKNEIKDN